MEDRPQELVDVGKNIMSNFDHKINTEIVNKLKEEGYYADYPGWNFHGEVWYDNGKWKCAIRIYHVHVETIVTDTPEEIMEQVSEKYGYD